jgi:hypothetical protein
MQNAPMPVSPVTKAVTIIVANGMKPAMTTGVNATGSAMKPAAIDVTVAAAGAAEANRK